MCDGEFCDFYKIGEVECCFLMCVDWGFVYQNFLDGLCMIVLVGVNVGEWFMVVGECYYGNICNMVIEWFGCVEIVVDCIDDQFGVFFGGMCQCLQIVCNFVIVLCFVFMDELIGGFDVFVQVCFFDLLCGLVSDFGFLVVIVIYDFVVVCFLFYCIMVMKDGYIVEQGLIDRVLDDL